MNSIDYSKIYGILLMLGKSYVSKLPPTVIEEIKCKMDYDYIPEYSIDNFNYSDELSEESLIYLNYLYLQYWQNMM